MLTAGRPYYARLAELDFAQARREVDEHHWLMLHLVARLLHLGRGRHDAQLGPVGSV
jgi:hypothetical protein